MMRYILFGGDIHYAKGGHHDCKGRSVSIDWLSDNAKRAGYQWWHILDTENGLIIEKSEEQAYRASHE